MVKITVELDDSTRDKQLRRIHDLNLKLWVFSKLLASGSKILKKFSEVKQSNGQEVPKAKSGRGFSDHSGESQSKAKRLL